MKNNILIIVLIMVSWIGGYVIGLDVGSRSADIIIEVDTDILDLACVYHEIDDAIYHRTQYTQADSSLLNRESGYYYFYAGQVKIPNTDNTEKTDLFNAGFRQWYVKYIGR